MFSDKSACGAYRLTLCQYIIYEHFILRDRKKRNANTLIHRGINTQQVSHTIRNWCRWTHTARWVQVTFIYSSYWCIQTSNHLYACNAHKLLVTFVGPVFSSVIRCNWIQISFPIRFVALSGVHHLFCFSVFVYTERELSQCFLTFDHIHEFTFHFKIQTNNWFFAFDLFRWWNKLIFFIDLFAVAQFQRQLSLLSLVPSMQIWWTVHRWSKIFLFEFYISTFHTVVNVFRRITHRSHH